MDVATLLAVPAALSSRAEEVHAVRDSFWGAERVGEGAKAGGLRAARGAESAGTDG